MKLALICNNLKIKAPPELLISNYFNLSPFVFGIFKNKTYLVLPSNIDDILANASNGNSKIKDDLAEFIIVHELSHTFNKDVPLISFIKYYLFKDHLLFWTTILLFFQILSIFLIPDELYNILSFNWIIIFPFLITLVFLNWALSDIKEYRQNYADARTSIFMLPDKIQRITNKDISSNLSPIEHLLDYFSKNPLCYSTSTGIKNKIKHLKEAQLKFADINESIIFRNIKTKLFRLFNIKNISNNRNDNISKKMFLYESGFSLNNRLSAYHGFGNSILFYIVLFVFNYLFYPISIDVSILFILFIIIYSSALFISPLRNSMNRTFNLSKYIKSLLNSYSISFLFFVLFSLLLTFGLVSFKRINLQSNLLMIFNLYIFAIPIYPASLLLTLILAGGVAGEGFKSKTRKDMYVAFIGILLLLILFTFIFIKTYPSLSVYDLLISFFIAMIFIFILRPFGGALGEDFLSWNFNKYKFQIDNLKHNKLIKTSIIFLFSIFFGFSVIVIPTLLSIILWNISSLPKIINNEFKVPLLLFLLFLLSLIIMITKPKVINYLKELTMLYKIINKNIPIKTKDEYLFKIKALKKLDGGYQNKAPFTPFYSDMITTSSGAIIEYFLNDKTENSTIQFILSCQNDSGGFGIVPKSYSRLNCTYLGLFSLAKANKLRIIKYNSKNHINWISACQTEEGYFCTVKHNSSSLEETFYALSSLDIINSLNSINKNSCFAWLSEHKDTLKNNFGDTFYFIKSLHLLGKLSENIKEEIINRHFLLLEKKALNLRVDTNADNLVKYIETIKLLNIENKSLVISKVKEILDKDK